jgi:transposase
MTKVYPSNLIWEPWELIADLFPSAKPGGRPRRIAMYAVVNAILYVLGCTWRGLPGDFPPWQTVYGYLVEIEPRRNLVKNLQQTLPYQWTRVSVRPNPSPTEAAVDSQSV